MVKRKKNNSDDSGSEDEFKIVPMDFLKKKQESCYTRKSNFLPKKIFRWLIVGESGSGKTCLLTNIIMKWLDYDCLMMFSPTLYDDDNEYNGIIELLEEAVKDKDIPLNEILVTGESIEDVPEVTDLSQNKRYCVVFDDFLTDKDQRIIEQYFSFGRHKGCAIFYLTQDFHSVPKIIRRNCNTFSFFDMDREQFKRALKNIGVNNVKFIESLYNKAISEDYGFFHIDKTQTKDWLRYRSGLNTFFLDDFHINLPDKLGKKLDAIM